MNLFPAMKLLPCLFLLLAISCQKKSEALPPVAVVTEQRAEPEWRKHALLTYEVIKEFPHDPTAFSQGLLLSQGQWVESTGGNGATSIRRVEKETGRVLLKKIWVTIFRRGRRGTEWQIVSTHLAEPAGIRL